MPVLSLGRRSVAQLAEVIRPTLFFDTDLKGFGLLASPKSKRNPDGAKTWFVQYRTGDGGRRAATKRVTIGPLSLLTAEKARQRAQILLAEARLGADHAALRKEARIAPTVAELAKLNSAETDTTRKARTVVLY